MSSRALEFAFASLVIFSYPVLSFVPDSVLNSVSYSTFYAVLRDLTLQP